MGEAGLCLGELIQATMVIPSPGGATERVHTYLASLTPDVWEDPGGGLSESGEDILVRASDLDSALLMVDSGDIADAKTILALQYLTLHWDALPDAEN